MKHCYRLLIAIALASVAPQVQAQLVHHSSEADAYVKPTDPRVIQKLTQWQDLKFGVIFHFGIYTQPGILESWMLCSEDVDWIPQRHLPYTDFKKWYWSQKDSLNPTQFDPNKWADIMKDAGMKYMVFTTKHHDGFCMFDSKYTDFSIAHGAFANDPRHNVALHVFDAFRHQNFMVGCYFSKPDWHCEYFWSPEFATPNRGINYKRERHPEWWQNYQTYTENQLTELLTDYGALDILWLDGGWISGEQVNLDRILNKARTGTQPGLIAVDRTIRGKNENYLTPEHRIPEEQLNVPWESCMTLSDDWSWREVDEYKSPRQVINILAQITAKGGSLLLGVGPSPQGTIAPVIEERLRGIGKWLRQNGKAIYNTRTTPFYHDGNTWFTADKDGQTIYAVYALPDGEPLPTTIEWTNNIPKGKMTLLQNGRRVEYQVKGDKVIVTLPKGLTDDSVAFSFKLKR